MLVVNLLFLSICTALFFLIIQNSNEIHQLVAWLSGLIALLCVFILIPPLIKGLLGLLLLLISRQNTIVRNSLK